MIKEKFHVLFFIMIHINFSSLYGDSPKKISDQDQKILLNKEHVKHLKRGKSSAENPKNMVETGAFLGSVSYVSLALSSITSGNYALAQALGVTVGGSLTAMSGGMLVTFTMGGALAFYPIGKSLQHVYRKNHHISEDKFPKIYPAHTKIQKIMHSKYLRTKSSRQAKYNNIMKTAFFDEIMIMLDRNGIKNFRKSRFTFDYDFMFEKTKSDLAQKRRNKHKTKKRQLESVAEIMAENLFSIKNKEQFLKDNFDNLYPEDSELNDKDYDKELNAKIVENIGVARQRDRLIFNWKTCPSKLESEKQLSFFLYKKLISSIKLIAKKYDFKNFILENKLFSSNLKRGWLLEENSFYLFKDKFLQISQNNFKEFIKEISYYTAKDLIQESKYANRYYWENGELKDQNTHNHVGISKLTDELDLSIKYLESRDNIKETLVLNLGWKTQKDL